MSKVTQAFILAAGRGERMKPLTDTIPKPLAKIRDKAMIDYALEKVSALPYITKIIVNSYYLAEVLEAHLKSLNNPKIIISHETEKLETGGGLINALPLFDSSKPILIINGDLFWQDESNKSILEEVIENFDEDQMDILLAVKPKDKFAGYEGNGDFNLSENGELQKAPNEKGLASHVYIGVLIIHPGILQNKPSEKFFSLNYYFKKAEGENGILSRIKGIEVGGKAFHIGTVDSLKMVNDQIIINQ